MSSPYMGFPPPHRAQLCSTNRLDRLNNEIKRRSDVPRAGLRPPEGRLGIFPNEAAPTRRPQRGGPNEAAVVRLIGALLLEQNDEAAVQRRCMTLETLAAVGDTALASLPVVAVFSIIPSIRFSLPLRCV